MLLYIHAGMHLYNLSGILIVARDIATGFSGPVDSHVVTGDPV